MAIFNPGFMGSNGFFPTNPLLNLTAAGPQSLLAYPLAEQASLRNFNFMMGTGLNAALGGAPVGPIQHIGNRLASEWIGGGRTDLALLLPNVTEINPLYFGPQFNSFQGLSGSPSVLPLFPNTNFSGINFSGASSFQSALALQGLSGLMQPAVQATAFGLG